MKSGACDVNRGHSVSKNPKINKNHNRQKMFKIGISIGRNGLNVEGHLQMGYNSKIIKNYNKPIETQPDETQLVETHSLFSLERNHRMVKRKNKTQYNKRIGFIL